MLDARLRLVQGSAVGASGFQDPIEVCVDPSSNCCGHILLYAQTKAERFRLFKLTECRF